jgi:sugar lactone lactonase YvrE
MRTKLFAATFVLSAIPLFAASYYPSRPDDPKAVYLTREEFGTKADGVADDTLALQNAIDAIEARAGEGIVFVPSGRYRLTKTVYIWPGVRLIGYGITRPLFLLSDSSPGFQKGPAYMFFFTGGRSKDGAPPPDAHPGTFYSAISNIDLDLGEGNPGAVGVRAHYAQHCFLAHMDFRVRSGLAGIHDGGNVAQDVHFYGGQYGIWTRKPSPGWQFTILDASFENQREAAIREHEAGLTLIRPVFRNVPTAIAIDDKYSDELWVKDGVMESISGPAIVISNEMNPRTEINVENVSCRGVPVFASFRESGKRVTAPGPIYEVSTFSHGLHYDRLGAAGQVQDVFETKLLKSAPREMPSDIRDLPSMESWVSVKALGAKGDGKSDDTAVLSKAIAEHPTLYFPTGQYLVSDTIRLKPDTVLIGLHPSVTRIFLADKTPAFEGVGSLKALLETPPQGTNIVTGLGLYTNGINPRAVGAKWMSGRSSVMNDVRFLGGHGTFDLSATAEENTKLWGKIYNNTHSADTELDRRWDGQYPSLWITGGGTFLDIWTPSTFAQAGLYISNSSVGGRIYQLSSEHHVRNEVVLDHSSNWEIYALQTEEERGEGGLVLPLAIRNSDHITFANLHMYRVVSSIQPSPNAIVLDHSTDIHFRNLHCYSDSKVSFDNSVYDRVNGTQLRQREFAWLDVSSGEPARPAMPDPAESAVEKLATGFFNISGGAVDKAGNLFFVDAQRQTIYRWDTVARELSKLRDNPLDPVQLFFDKSGDLLVVSSAGKGVVYSLKPDDLDGEIVLIPATAAVPRPGMTAILPPSFWRNENDFTEVIPRKQPFQFVSPDGTTFLPAGEEFVSGELYYGSKLNDTLRAFGLAPIVVGNTAYFSDESGQKTYVGRVTEDGTISDLKLFVERGGESVAVDGEGNVYIAAGQILAYDRNGRQIGTIDVPERPSQLLFGGANKQTLFILARSSLYAAPAFHAGHTQLNATGNGGER